VEKQRPRLVVLVARGTSDNAALFGRYLLEITTGIPRRVKQILTPIPYIVPAQIFAACLAVHKGLDPDKPPTLTKVTLTL
jgi:fructoselysine-6-P-deglycase FrlB-like protein